MATGTVKWFAQALHNIGKGIHDLSTADLRMGIITNAAVPTVSTAAPHWGGTGTTNFATNQVATTGTSYTGPVALSSEAWTLNAAGAVLDYGDVSLPQDASGFTNGAYAIIYNNTDVNKRALAFVELSAGGTASLVVGPVVMNVNASGFIGLQQA